MIREVDLVSYLPPFMQEYETLTKTLEAENPEFVLLWKAAERTLKNVFIATADEYGIARFEKILNILPEKDESLEERRAKLMMKNNLRSPYTFSFLKSLISSIIGEENYTIERLYELYQLKICIINQDIRQTKNIYNVINSLLPDNMKLLLYAEYRETAEVNIGQAMSITFVPAVYPRFNLPVLFLNDTWELDGSRRLSGYDGTGRIDLYPVQMEIQTSIEETPEVEPEVSFLMDAREEVESTQGVEVRVSAECRETTEESLMVQITTAVNAEVGDVMVDNLNYLDDGWGLDGSRELNGGVYGL